MISCPSCGGSLRFVIAEQKMVCDHCDSRFRVEELSEDSNRDEARASAFDCYVYLCPSCGAEILTTDRNDAVGFCQYCGGASLIFEKIRQEWKPDTIIPFQITKEQCKEAYRKEVKRYIFVSKKYRDAELIENFRGVYMPYWNYCADMSGVFKLRVVTPSTKIDSNTYEIIHYDLVGNSNYMVEGYAKDASLTFDDDLSDSLIPYNPDGQQPFLSGYLSGFYAETGNVSPHEYDIAVMEEMKKDAVVIFNNDSTVTECMEVNSFKFRPAYEHNLPIKISSVKRTLNPVWFMSYRNGNSITYATVNGQTGKVAADLPLSPLRILVAALGISALIFSALLVLMDDIPSIKANTTLALCLLLTSGGMYYLQYAFNRTVDKPRKSAKGISLCNGKSYTFALTLGTVCAIIFTSDGSYQQALAEFAVMPLVGSGIFMLICHIVLIADFRKVRKQIGENDSYLRARITEEAYKFMSHAVWLKLLMYLSIVVGIIIARSDLAFSVASYGMSAVLAIELFILAVCHIRFQTQVAKRPLPQFNKKGAYYDEHE